MRVLHLHRIRGISGSERHLLTLLPALRALGIDARFLGLDDPKGEPEPFYAELAAGGVPYARVTMPRDFAPVVALRVARVVRGSADLVHTHLVHGDLYGTLGAIAAGVPMVSTKHNDDPFRTGAFRYAERLLSRRAAKVIAITSALARFNVARVGLPPAKVVVVPYGLDEPPPATGSPLPVPDDVPLVLAVGRLVEQKGHETAVRAIAELAQQDAVLAVLGDGAEREPLRALAEELGVGTRVVLPGNVQNVGDWLRRADVFVHPARWEGFGLVLLEAMLCSLPIVATNVSSVPEIVVDGVTGTVVAHGDHASLADGLERLLGDEPTRTRMGLAGRERARSGFSVARMAEATAAVYEKVVAASPAV